LGKKPTGIKEITAESILEIVSSNSFSWSRNESMENKTHWVSFSTLYRETLFSSDDEPIII